MADKTGYKELVSIKGTEKEFITLFISAFTGLDDSITCSGSPDQYDSSDIQTKPTFIFSIDNIEVFKLERAVGLGSSTFGFNIYMNTINGPYSLNAELAGWNITSAADASTTRGVRLSWINSNNFMLFDIHASVERYGWKSHKILFTKSGNKYYGSSATYNNADGKSVFYNISDMTVFEYNSNPLKYGSFVSRFPFISRPGTIDYVKSSVYVFENYKKFDMPMVCDSTTVTTGETVALRDGAYIAVGPHQLVKIS